MLFAYLIALLPALVGGALWALRRDVVWWEWLLITASGFAVSAVFHVVALHAMTGDVEVWSGRVLSARHTPMWTEAYEEPVYRTVQVKTDKGIKTRQEQVGWRPAVRVHPPMWSATDDLDGAAPISPARYEELKQAAGGEQRVPGIRFSGSHGSHLLLGDPFDHEVRLPAASIVPVMAVRSWENRIKASPSTFSFAPVPEGAAVYPYPLPEDRFRECRLLGEAAKHLPPLEWGRMNTRLGAAKKVNVILIAYPTGGQDLAELQRSAWLGGKKNDVVICCGPLVAKTVDGKDIKAPSWTWTFGWTDAELVKTTISSALLQRPLDGTVIPVIEDLIRQHYTIRDWSGFDYLDVDVPWWSYAVLIAVMAVVSGALMVWSVRNRF